jgi:phosphopantothenoylcysteine decarboxylase/phosphopantothenate--cysteine ligase
MHTEMWEHPATRANVETLRGRGCLVVEPAVGRLTGADSGAGRLPDPVEIAALARTVLARGGMARDGTGRLPGPVPDLAGRRIVISAGGTREYLDPVRFLGNASSGRQGQALARAALTRGAQVVVVAANVALAEVPGVRTVRVVSAAQLRTVMHAEAAQASVVIMAAAVADFRPATRTTHKIKKSDTDPEPMVLVRNPDILVELVAARRAGQVLVGFAAETAGPGPELVELGREKRARKGVDLLVVNQVGDGLGFDVEDNAAVVLDADGTETVIERTSKDHLAHRVLDLVVARLAPLGGFSATAVADGTDR